MSAHSLPGSQLISVFLVWHLWAYNTMQQKLPITVLFLVKENSPWSFHVYTIIHIYTYSIELINRV